MYTLVGCSSVIARSSHLVEVWWPGNPNVLYYTRCNAPEPRDLCKDRDQFRRKYRSCPDGGTQLKKRREKIERSRSSWVEHLGRRFV